MKILFLFPLLLISCKQPSPEIIIPKKYKIGESFDFKVTGLETNEEYELVARKTDNFDREWLSKATFKADDFGQINLSNSTPIKGTYEKKDLYGLFWSMTMTEELGDDWTAPEPIDFSTINFSLVRTMDTLGSVSTRQYTIPQGIETETLNDQIVAKIMRPSNYEQPLPAIILLGGSGGGLSWASRMGALLADEGYATMALAYFNEEKLPKNLAQIPLEYIENAINELIRKNYIDENRIGILGYSKGAELALLMASRNSEIKCIAAIAPGSAVFQGFKPPKFPVLSSWSLNGEDLEFVPNAYDKRFFETYDGMYLWYRTLSQHDKVEKASIPVENIHGDILLVSGVKDKIWPSTYMSEQIISRLNIAKFENNYEHIALPFAGHGIAEPPGHPTTSLSSRLGGTAYGNAKAREVVWESLKNFFNRSLNTNKEAL
ncbi:MAG: hypothetical protein HKN52_07155 [Eudoraea sp.]|nr:hypothetical protein [Eudoraea sp.]